MRCRLCNTPANKVKIFRKRHQLCNRCYLREKRKGALDLRAVRPQNMTSKGIWQHIKQHQRKVTPNGCWLFTGAKSQDGYGAVRVKGRLLRVHRFAYMSEHNVQLTSEQLVCHHCDTPLCINPEHLFLGSNEDNMADMAAKGRSRGPAVLTPQKVRAIRFKYGSGLYTMKELAKEYGCTIPYIHYIVTGKHRKSVK